MSGMFRSICFVTMMALLALGPAARAQDDEELMLTLDEELARLAEQIPGFGGLYLDEEGTTHVHLVDLSRAREVQDLGERVEVHQGAYDFRALFAWKDQVRDLLARPGTLSLDIDERRNRLVFEVEREALDAFRAELPMLLRSARVPAEAVLVEAGEPIVNHVLLTDRFRPIPGGVQIRTNGGACTLGFNATWGSTRGFVTASHCTNTPGGVEGTVFFQNTVSSANQVGTELIDPQLFTKATDGDCPSGRQCRYSDAAFVDYSANSLSEGGQIANGFLCGVAGVAGTLDVNPFQSRIPVVNFTFGSPVSGSVVAKVGRTTGCTLGAQKDTCTDVNVFAPVPGMPGFSFDTKITMLCQNRVSALSQGGDSGSPVYLHKSAGATVAGVLWGGNGSSYVFSPLLLVHLELGGVFPELD